LFYRLFKTFCIVILPGRSPRTHSRFGAVCPVADVNLALGSRLRHRLMKVAKACDLRYGASNRRADQAAVMAEGGSLER